MKLFTVLYHKVMRLAQKPHAPYYLAGLSFTEASFFPIPPDVMLVPMVLAQPEKTWRFAWVTTLASVVGGLFGYLLGMYAFSYIYPLIDRFGYVEDYNIVHHWFVAWGAAVILLAGFTPVPYKLFTFVAGVMGMPILAFFIASCVGRAARFFLVAGVMKWGSHHVKDAFVRYIEWVGWSLVVIFIVLIFLVGCAPQKLAPVVEGWQAPAGQHSRYRVQKGDTIYTIAWQFNKDYRDIIQANHLKSPYALHLGESIVMNKIAEASVSNQRSVHRRYARSSYQKSRRQAHDVLNIATRVKKWSLPANGRIVHGFSTKSGGNKGIDIAGHYGERIITAAPGRVVYAGTGLRGYGKLIIIKHNDSYLSAYAYNKRILVQEGQRVTAKQNIALMGRNNAGKVMLHFEIRKNGHPVNPLRYLH